MTVEEYILIIAPEFVGMDLTGVIAIAELRVAKGFCGDKRDLIVAYLAAHIKTIADKTAGTDGSIDNMSEGGLSLSYSTVTSDINNNYTSTPYGREYESLIEGCVITPRTRRTCDY